MKCQWLGGLANIPPQINILLIIFGVALPAWLLSMSVRLIQTVIGYTKEPDMCLQLGGCDQITTQKMNYSDSPGAYIE